MKVTEIKAAVGPPKAKPIDGSAPEAEVHIPKDRVSVKATKEAESAVSAAQHASGGHRAARAERLEAEVRSGSYRPDPGRVAEQMMADAEIDARISAMLRH